MGLRRHHRQTGCKKLVLGLLRLALLRFALNRGGLQVADRCGGRSRDGRWQGGREYEPGRVGAHRVDNGG